MISRLPFFPDLNNRYSGPEAMDNFQSEQNALNKTLSDLTMINRYLSSSTHLLKKYILAYIANNECNKISFLDLGAGGGDLARWLAKEIRRLKKNARIICLDYDQRCIDYAKEKNKAYKEIEFLNMSALNLHTLKFNPDFIFSSHFLHHLEDAVIPDLLRSVKEKAKIGFLMNDLRRSYLSYSAYFLLWPIFKGNSYTWKDGLLSIRKGFTVNEMKKFITSAGLLGSTECFPFVPGRIVVTNLKPFIESRSIVNNHSC